MIELNKQSDDNYEIKLEKSFDFENHGDFRFYVKKIIDADAKKLSINFQDVEYIDSSALGMLMLAKHETDQHNCELQLSNVKNGHAKDVLNLVKFNQIFTICEI
ncbi:MAG: anti-anti-sigma factor [Alphaproteobacteria bacterium]|jgi:anti-anti-sigma factor